MTITGDDKHTVHVWNWMLPENKYCKAVNVPGWHFGPEKKLEWLKGEGEQPGGVEVEIR